MTRSKPAPLGNICAYCGVEIDGLPYRCNRCNDIFCMMHRLPEVHECKAMRNIAWKYEPRPFTIRKPPRRRKLLKKISKITVAIVIIVFLIQVVYWVATTPNLIPQGEASAQASVDIAQLEGDTFDLINQERMLYGLQPVIWNDEVAEVAREHSKDMAQKNFFEHTNLSGQGPGERLSEAGIGYSSYGEILYQGNIVNSKTTTVIVIVIIPIPITTTDYKSQSELAQAAVSGWMGSTGHREIILTSWLTQAGLGVAVGSDGETYYFTDDFIA